MPSDQSPDGLEQEACPDCKSTDVSRTGNWRSPQPPWYCYDCGIRFESPRHILPERGTT